MSQSAFEQYLKNSNHFIDVINTHRRATADVIAILLHVLRQENQITDPMIDKALKRVDEIAASSGPSLGSDTRLIGALVRERLRSLSKP